MKEELENIYMLLFRFVGDGFQLALCNVGWLATRKFVVLVPDPIVFAPWSVLLDLGQLCDSCQDTSDEVDPRIGKSDFYQQPIAGLRSFAACCPPEQWTPLLVVVLCSLFLSHAPSQVHWKGDVVDTERYWTLKEFEWEDSQKIRAEEHATNHDTNKLRSDDDGSSWRGVLISQDTQVFVSFERAEATARVDVPTATQEFSVFLFF